MERKRKCMSSSEAEKEARLYSQTVEFVCHYYKNHNQEERKVLDVVRLNMVDIYRNYYNKVFYPPKPGGKKSYNVKLNEDDVSAVIKEYRSLVENELNYFFENMINVATKQAIKDFIVDFKQGDITKHSHIWDCWSGLSFIKMSAGNGKTREKNSNAEAPTLTQLEMHQQIKDDKEVEDIIKQEANHYRETKLFLRSFAHNKEATDQELVSLRRAYTNVNRVFTDFLYIYSTKEESWSQPDVSLMIKEHRSKVEEELNYVCNKVSNVTIKEAYHPLLTDFQTGPKPKESWSHTDVSLMIKEHKVEEELNYVCNKVSNVTIKEAYHPLLADFQTGPKPKDPPSQIHPKHLQDMSFVCEKEDGNIMSSKPNTSSGEGSSKPVPICKCHHTPPWWDKPKPIYQVIVQEYAECPPDLTDARKYLF